MWIVLIKQKDIPILMLDLPTKSLAEHFAQEFQLKELEYHAIYPDSPYLSVEITCWYVEYLKWAAKPQDYALN